MLIKSLQELGVFSRFSHIPQTIIYQIANKVYLPIPTMEVWNAYGESRNYEKHYHFFWDYLKIHLFDIKHVS